MPEMVCRVLMQEEPGCLNAKEKRWQGIAPPPFKGSIDKSDINDALTIQTPKTEPLFVERMMLSPRIGECPEEGIPPPPHRKK